MKIKLPHLSKEIDIDTRIEEIVQTNFDANEGAEYWIRYAKENKLRPRDITSYDDLHHLGFHDWSIFKDGRANELIPKLAQKQTCFFKTTSSGTTSPKKIGFLPYSFLSSSNKWWLYNVAQSGCPFRPRIWGVGSPEFWGKNVEYVAEKNEGLFAAVYPESRGAKEFLTRVKELQRTGNITEVIEMVFNHYRSLVEDTINIFKAIQPNTAVAPANVLLQILPLVLESGGLDTEKYLESMNLIVTGGDELTKEMYSLMPEYFPRAKFLPYFGHFLTGAAFGRNGLNYYPNAAGTMFDIVGEDNERVKRGDRGRVVISFYDTILWRAKDDAGRSVGPIADIGWDGVTDISRYNE